MSNLERTGLRFPFGHGGPDDWRAETPIPSCTSEEARRSGRPRRRGCGAQCYFAML